MHFLWLVAGDVLELRQCGAGDVQLREGGQQGRRQGSASRAMLTGSEDTGLIVALASREVASPATRFAGDARAGWCWRQTTHSVATWLSTACVRQCQDKDKGRLYLQDRRLCFGDV